MVTEVVDATETVVTVKVLLVDPATTVMLAGTVATDVLLLDSATTAPPDGAAFDNVTVPCEELPPVTLVGLKVSDCRVTAGEAGLTVSVANLLTPPWEPVIAADDVAVTTLEETVNVALVAPAATVTLAGTVATDVLLLDSVTTAPPDGAAPDSVTVPVEGLPPVTLVGLSESEESVRLGGLTVRMDVLLAPLQEPEMFAVVDCETALVLTEKVALVAPPDTVTLVGTVAAEVLLLASITTAPLDGAGLVRVTVP